MVPTRMTKRIAAVATATLAVVGLAGVAVAAPPAQDRGPQDRTTALRLIAFNDFHGNLQPPAGSSGRVTLPDGKTVDAGGAAYLATHVQRLRGEVPGSLVLSAGDNIGASPLTSALFHDEPTIEFLDSIGVQAAVIGNHEFDEGYRELLRMQFGGCHPTDGCQFRPRFDGAGFPHLGANITFENGAPAALPFTIKSVDGVPVGVIGVTLEDLPLVVLPEAVEGFRFGDEVTALDKASRVLDALGVRTQVVLMHQGDNTEGGGPDDCRTVPGPARAIASAASASIDAFFTGHSHQQYNCVVNDPAGNPRPLIQGSSFGRLLSVVDLTIDGKTRDVVRDRTRARNEIVTRTVTPDPATLALVEEAAAKAAPIANRPVGTIAADLVRAAAPSGESPLGDVIADAQLAATAGNGAQIAMTNPGGIRTDLAFPSSPAGEGNGVVTYGEAFAVQPFGNIMQTITLSGTQLKAVLEQQWQPQPNGTVVTRFLQVSSTLRYSWSRSGTQGERVSGITIGGLPVDPAATYRVSVNNFLAGGGDGFSALAGGTEVTGGPIDLDAFTAYLTAHPGLVPPPADRVTVLP